jgi:hypothetical protein
MNVALPPLLLVVLGFIFMANLIPFVIFLAYRRRLYQKLQQRRNSNEDIQTSADVFDDEEEPECLTTSLSKSSEDGDDKGGPEIDAAENGVTVDENARKFVEKQEQALTAARSRWMSRSKGYSMVNTTPLKDK